MQPPHIGNRIVCLSAQRNQIYLFCYACEAVETVVDAGHRFGRSGEVNFSTLSARFHRCGTSQKDLSEQRLALGSDLFVAVRVHKARL